MPDEITIKQKSESNPVSDPDNQTASPGRTQLVNFCAAGLGISFFLPWANIFIRSLSGFDLQKAGNEQLLLWLIPILCIITIITGVARKNQQIPGQIAGLLPFIVGIYWYCKIKDDLFHMLTYGAYLSLFFGAALFVLARKSK